MKGGNLRKLSHLSFSAEHAPFQCALEDWNLLEEDELEEQEDDDD